MASDDSIIGLGSAAAWKNAVVLFSGAIGRRWASVAAITLVFSGVGIAAAAMLPRTYWSESTLLVTKNSVMPALANPRRPVQMGSEVPIQSAIDAVLSRPSLEGMVRSNDLVQRWSRGRSPVMQLKERAGEWMSGPISGDDKRDALVDLLAQRIVVTTVNDTITVKASWTDRRGAVDIVNSTVAAFLETRRTMEVQAIAETYEILERRAGHERAQVDLRIAAGVGVERATSPSRSPALRAAMESASPSRLLVARSTPGGAAVDARQAKDEGLDALRARVLEVRRNRAELEQRHHDKSAQVEASLAEQRGIQTDRHPSIVAMRRSLDQLRQEPDEVRQSRDEEARVLADYFARGGNPDLSAGMEPAAEPVRDTPAPAPVDIAAPRRADLTPLAVPAMASHEDDSVEFARALYKGSVDSYQELVGRLGDVQLELETAKASFGHRYTVIQPARLPKRANSPNVLLILIGALLAGLLAGVLRAVFSELRALSLLSPAALAGHLSSQGPDAVAV